MKVTFNNKFTVDAFNFQEVIRPPLAGSTEEERALSIQSSDNKTLDEMKVGLEGNLDPIILSIDGQTVTYNKYTKLVSLSVNWRPTGSFIDIQLGYVE